MTKINLLGGSILLGAFTFILYFNVGYPNSLPDTKHHRRPRGKNCSCPPKERNEKDKGVINNHAKYR